METPPLAALIDTHCHLEMEQFDADRVDVIASAEASGVEAMITVASDLQSNAQGLEIAASHPSVFASVGLHPHEAAKCDEQALIAIRDLAKHPRVVAIGETGLDYHYDLSPRDMQRAVFRSHLDLAKDLGLPVIVHSREAQDDTMRILAEAGTPRGVLHCFSGDEKMAHEALALGLFISFAGPVTFRNADRLKKIASLVPDDFLLLETDAPYLAPVPLRGRRNEPRFLRHTAESLAGIRGVSVDDIARVTTLNAKRLFGIGHVGAEGAIAYQIRNSLYLNITNRCTNLCGFCVRHKKDFVKGHNLRLTHEPSADELKAAIGDPRRYDEIVFCGYGEPLLRLDVVKAVSRWVKDAGGRIRINTNGHGNLIHGRNIIPELRGIVDALSISIDAQDGDTYETVCRPVLPEAFESVLGFAREATMAIPEVVLTVVEVEGVDVQACRGLARAIGAGFRVRRLDDVG